MYACCKGNVKNVLTCYLRHIVSNVLQPFYTFVYLTIQSTQCMQNKLNCQVLIFVTIIECLQTGKFTKHHILYCGYLISGETTKEKEEYVYIY